MTPDQRVEEERERCINFANHVHVITGRGDAAGFNAWFDGFISLARIVAHGPDMEDFTAPTAQAIIREQWIEMVKNQAEKLL